jgi:putative transposase
LNLFNYGKIGFRLNREIQGKIKQVQITTKNNKWYLNITTDFCDKPNEASGSIAIDIGLKHLVVATDGTKVENCTHAKYFDKQISALQSRADKLKKGSRKQKYLRKVINRLYDVKCRKINDFQHKVSRRLANKYDTIYAENLSVKKMSEGHWTNLNKAIRNAKFAQFISFLSYKTNKLVLVNPYNTSKTCNNCGFINENLKLSDRIIVCANCKEKYDRDENAAKNIFCLGQAINSGLCSEKATIQEVLK